MGGPHLKTGRIWWVISKVQRMSDLREGSLVYEASGRFGLGLKTAARQPATAS